MEAKKPTLDYATPSARAASDRLRGVMLAMASLPIGGLSAFTLWIGIGGVAQCMMHPSSTVDLPHDAFAWALFTIVGLFCGLAAIGWFFEGCRMARRA